MELTRPHLITRRLTTALLVSVLISLPLLVLAADNIGIAAVATEVQIEGKGTFNINDEVAIGDVIKTGEKGSVTILFNDESMLTLGPNSTARLDSYNEAPPGEAKVTILSGNFRYFPGTILEQGGNQTVINQGASNSASETEVAISETGLDNAIEGSNDVLDVSISELNTNDLVLTEAISGSAVVDGAPTATGAPGNNDADVNPF